MRKLLVLTAAAPLALLAACGDSDTDTMAETDTAAMADAETNATTAAADMDAPSPATTLADAGDYSGTYSMSAPDGTMRGVTLNSSDSTYSYTAADGTERTGSYTVAPDGYRLSIEDFYGTPAYFAISNGSLVRLQGDTAIDETNIEVTGERYARSQGEDDAIFSRDPSLGSPVAPPAGEE